MKILVKACPNCLEYHIYSDRPPRPRKCTGCFTKLEFCMHGNTKRFIEKRLNYYETQAETANRAYWNRAVVAACLKDDFKKIQEYWTENEIEKEIEQAID